MTSSPQKVTVKNTGSALLTMETAPGNACEGANPCVFGSYAGDYTILGSTCQNGDTIPVGTTCTFSVEFTSSTPNEEESTVYLYDNAANSPQTIPVTGTGTPAQVKLSTGKLSFFSKQTGATSPAQRVTVTNTGKVLLQMETAPGNVCEGGNPCALGSYAGDYAILGNTCQNGDTIPVGTTCTFLVEFTPSTTNQEESTIYIYDNAANSPQTIPVTGLATAARVAVSVKSLVFPAKGSGPVGLGLTSSSQKVTVSNTAKVPVQMGYGSPSGTSPSISTSYTKDFAIIGNSCADHVIPAGTTCTFSVEFTASTLNDEVGTVVIYDNAAGSPQTISLAGQATAAHVKLSAKKLTFSSRALGTTSAAQKVTVTNTGEVPLQMGYGSTSGVDPSVSGSYSKDFTIFHNNCADYTIVVGKTCTFWVEFTPSTSNDETGTLLIYDNSADSPEEIALAGSIS